MKIAIVGAGAIGGYVGVKLALAGEVVSVIARGANLAAIRSRGLKLILNDGTELVARDVAVTADYASLDEQISFDCDTAVALMTHNFLDDAQLLRLAMDTEARGIFILSSRGRARKLFEAVEADGRMLTRNDLARIHAPAGLEVGAKTPAQIALSIMAEMQQVFSGGSAKPLRERPAPEDAAWQSR